MRKGDKGRQARYERSIKREGKNSPSAKFFVHLFFVPERAPKLEALEVHWLRLCANSRASMTLMIESRSWSPM
jgi:hypothetical protein